MSCAEIAGVELTHPDRVLYPEQGITKRELALYYAKIADWILPHVEGRPLTLVRCPEGHKKQCFYQRHLRDSNDPAIVPIKVRERGSIVSYVSVDSLAGLVALVQMGVLELHAWGSRKEKINRPDRLIFDLDPDPAVPWNRLRDAARRLHWRLADLGLNAFVKTTGGKGLHVVVPIQRRAGWDQVSGFARTLAYRMAEDSPTRYLAKASKAERKGRIFVDWLRNTRGATSIAVWSTRARAGVARGGRAFRTGSWQPDIRPARSPARQARSLAGREAGLPNQGPGAVELDQQDRVPGVKEVMIMNARMSEGPVRPWKVYGIVIPGASS